MAYLFLCLEMEACYVCVIVLSDSPEGLAMLHTWNEFQDKLQAILSQEAFFIIIIILLLSV